MLKVSRILHAGYIFECNEVRIAFDPIFENPFSGNCYAFPSVDFDTEAIKKINFSAVFISHFHDDHCSLESLNLLDRKTPIYIYCLHEEIHTLIRKLGFQNVYSLKWNEVISVGPIEIIPRRALDADVDSLFQIKAEGLNILNVVDSWIDEATLDLLIQEGPWDMILWPFQTMRELEVLVPSHASPSDQKLPEEWKEQLKLLNPSFVVPSSCQFIHEEWSWYNYAFFPISYQQFEEQIKTILPKSQVVRMDPGVSIGLCGGTMRPLESLSWIHRRSNRVEDYQYDPHQPVPLTSEIAQKIAGLSPAQKERVRLFCEAEIIERYQDTHSDGGGYFSKPRHWQLSVYDDQGRVVDYTYLVNKNNLTRLIDLKRVDEIKSESCWRTEAIEVKIYGALEKGESLTSMYLRIIGPKGVGNFHSEAPSVDFQIDPLEDPLVRCLFCSESSVAAYQRVQLSKICQSSVT